MRVVIERIGSSAMWLLLLAVLYAPSTAAAQDPDMREIFPYVMLVIDTSGSMEYMPSCPCTTPGCTECLPTCDPGAGLTPEKNRWAVTLEALTGRFNNFRCERLPRTTDFGATYDAGYFLPYHQPWSCTTGDFCSYGAGSVIDQESDGILDQYIGRMHFGLMTFDGWDTYKGAPPLIQPPSPDPASFDVVRSEGRDGLWSYGGFKTFRYPGCKEDYAIDTGVRSPKAEEGSLVSINSCTGGVPNTAACPSWCTSCNANEATLNTDIQEALLTARPYGGTPIAAALDDLYYHFRDLQTSGADEFGSCRNRFALLVTDGRPDSDYRDLNCQCGESGTAIDRCMPPGEPLAPGDPIPLQFEADNMRCPYPAPEEAARNLVRGRVGSGGADEDAMIERLFVIGLSVSDTDVLDRLNDIAEAGCTEENCADEDGNTAFFADDFDTLVQNLSEVLSGFTKPISRSIPAFGIPSKALDPDKDPPMKQFQISTGFRMPNERRAPRTGVIERTRLICDANGKLESVAPSESARDDFEKTLNAQQPDTRTLWTAVPYSQAGSGWSTVTPVGPHDHLWKSSTSCGDNGCTDAHLRTIVPERFGPTVTTASERDAIYNWMLGVSDPNATGDLRERFELRRTRRLGDIYHASPVIVAAPRFDSADEGFNRFRQRPDIAGRPQMLYINTNDGLLHAFHLERFTPLTGDERPQGHEEWAFVPPLLLDRLEENVNGHQITLDATPVVKNVFMSRTNRADPTSAVYKTVLITGLRGGGKGYVALDVTDPIAPKFLWQFTDPEMGFTFGQAAIGQAVYTFADENAGLPQEGAVAILPGGVGEQGAETGECAAGVNSNPSMRVPSTNQVYKSTHLEPGAPIAELAPLPHRADLRCWKKQGRAIYFVEVETGRLIKKLYLDSSNNRMFPSPIVSSPAIYPADVGSLMTEAFVTDADGVIWRIDMRAYDQKKDDGLDGWTARPFHDIFYDRSPTDGELTYEAPMLSVNEQEQVVVIVGTGDNNNFVKTKVHNRIVSLTEEIYTETGMAANDPRRFRARVNWEMRFGEDDSTPRMVESELVTGTMALFNGQLFFSTFIAVNPGGDVCDMGKGRIHVVDYIHPDPRRLNQDEPPTIAGGPARESLTFPPRLILGVEQPSADGTTTGVINVSPANAEENLMLVGLTLTQRPSCKAVAPDDSIWDDQLFTPREVDDPSVYLVAQGSGDDSDLLKSQTNDGLRKIDVQLARPATFSRVVSWATSVD